MRRKAPAKPELVFLLIIAMRAQGELALRLRCASLRTDRRRKKSKPQHQLDFNVSVIGAGWASQGGEIGNYGIFVVLWAIFRGFYRSANPKPIINYCKIVGKMVLYLFQV